MGSNGTKLKIGTLKARIEASRQNSASLASEFKKASTSTEKTRIAFRYGEALKQARSLELLSRCSSAGKQKPTANLPAPSPSGP